MASWASKRTGEVWTTSGAGADPQRFGQSAWCACAGTDYVSTPDSTPLRFAGDFTIIARFSTSVPAPVATPAAIATKRQGGSSYQLRIASGGFGTLELATTSGGVTAFRNSTAAPPITANQPIWVKAQFIASSGGNNITRFYTSPDGVNWTQVGVDVVLAGAVVIDAAASLVELGNAFAGVQPLNGKVFYAAFYNASGILVASFDADDASLGAIGTSAVDTFSADGATVADGSPLNQTVAGIVDALVGLQLPSPVAVPNGSGASTASVASASPTATITRVQ